MSIAILLLTALMALIISNMAVNGLPSLLIGWIHLPTWLLWTPALALVAWCMDSETPE